MVEVTLMDPIQRKLLETTRRHFFGQCAVGLGQMALASLLRNGRIQRCREYAASQSSGTKAPAFCFKSQECHLLVYGWRSEPTGSV